MKTQILTITLGIFVLVSLAFSLMPVQALIIDSVAVDPSEVAPGETATIIMELDNENGHDVEDVSVKLIFRELILDKIGNIASIEEVPFAPFDSGSEFTIDEINEGDEEDVSFKIIVLNNARSGIYKIPVEITYTDAETNITKTKSSLIPVTVNSEPVLSINLENGLLLKGKENEITVKIINKGLSDVQFLEVELVDSSYVNLLSPKSVYIGDIDSDDFDTAKFQIYFKDRTPEKLTLSATLKYQDAVLNEYEEKLGFQVKVYSREKAIELGLIKKSYTLIYAGIIVGLLVIYIIYKKVKKQRRLKNKARA